MTYRPTMRTNRVRTSGLTDIALDWAVAKALDLGLYKDSYLDGNLMAGWYVSGLTADPNYWVKLHRTKFSSSWELAGPIIERIAGFELKSWPESKPETRCEVHIHNYDGNWIEFGSTILIAAMRCFVASKLGEEIDVPDSLVTHWMPLPADTAMEKHK